VGLTNSIFYRNLPDGMVQIYSVETLKNDIVRMVTSIKQHGDKDVFKAYVLTVHHINTMMPGQQENYRHQFLHAFCCSDHTLKSDYGNVHKSAFIRLLQIICIVLNIEP